MYGGGTVISGLLHEQVNITVVAGDFPGGDAIPADRGPILSRLRPVTTAGTRLAVTDVGHGCDGPPEVRR
jgi:hypothetical protein